jgi:hypothetical protein
VRWGLLLIYNKEWNSKYREKDFAYYFIKCWLLLKLLIIIYGKIKNLMENKELWFFVMERMMFMGKREIKP